MTPEYEEPREIDHCRNHCPLARGEDVVSESTAAPRFSWRALIAMLTFMAALATGIAIVRSDIAALHLDVKRIDDYGSAGLRAHLNDAKDEITEFRVANAELKAEMARLRDALARVEANQAEMQQQLRRK